MAELEVQIAKSRDEGYVQPPNDRLKSLKRKWNDKFSSLDEKMDTLLNRLNRSSSCSPQRHTSSSTLTQSQKRKRRLSDWDSLDSQEDLFSLRASGRLLVSSESSDENNNISKTIGGKIDQEELSESTQKCLFDIFGDDATVKKSVKKEGIKLDKSQLEVLENEFRCKCPNDLTAFSEEYFDAFPVGEETENYLEVPPLDPLVETCLLNHHGRKSFFQEK